MKSKRQEKILELIHDHSVQTQEQLLAELNDAGFRTTQATISRDIKQLRIIKELGPDGVYRYSTTPKPVEHTFSAKLNLIFRQCITSVDYAQNMIVIKTMPGPVSYTHLIVLPSKNFCRGSSVRICRRSGCLTPCATVCLPAASGSARC